jgi:hypothetical protein
LGSQDAINLTPCRLPHPSRRRPLRLLPTKPGIADDGGGGDLLAGPLVRRNGGRPPRWGVALASGGAALLSLPHLGLAGALVAAGCCSSSRSRTTVARAATLDGGDGVDLAAGGGRPVLLTVAWRWLSSLSPEEID